MLVNVGKRIIVQQESYVFTCDCTTPGKVEVTSGGKGPLSLPGNPEEAERFIAAYRRILAEDVSYVSFKSE